MKWIIIFCLLLALQNSNAQTLPFKGTCSYIFGDNPAFSSPGFNDGDWKTIESSNIKWERKELPSDKNCLWLRKKIVIPSSLKTELNKTGALSLYLGRIMQEDQTFFNGQLIGETVSGDLTRAYIINEAYILWDKENVFAFRIHHWGDECAIGQIPTIAAANPKNIFIISAAQNGTINNKPVAYNFIVQNKSDKNVAATITTIFYNAEKQQLKKVQQKVTLKSGDNKYAFPYQINKSFIKITCTVTVPEYNYTNSYNTVHGYNNVSYKAIQPVIAYKAKYAFSPADLNRQKISGWLGERLKANKDQRLHKVDEEALLAGYINKPGIHPWIGEHAGKFLEAACNTYQNTKDAGLKIQIDRTAQHLISSQLSDGYLGTYETESHWTSWDVWSHKYNIIGLLSYYQLSGYKPALLAAEKAADLLCSTFGTGKGQRDIIEAGTHVGMAATSVLEPMTDLYIFSGNKKYLDFCYYIVASFNNANGPHIIANLDSTGRVDKTANAKAYEMLSNLLGLVKLYRVTNDAQFLKPVLAAWKDITENRLYITGTTSSYEHFQDNHVLPAGTKDHIGESCVTTTWIQLNYQLLCIFGTMEYVNELERSVYNHLTGAENPQTGCVSYYTPLMGAKPYGCDITCCMSSVPRGIAMVPLFTNGKINGDPAFLFYQPGVYQTNLSDTKSTAVEFITTTTFPEEGNVTITVNPSVTSAFGVLLRKPYWADDFIVAINGVEQNNAGNDVQLIKRSWSKGDKITIRFSMPVKLLDGNISYPGSVAFQRGPQVLVYDKKLNSIAADKLNIPANFKLQNAVSVLPKNWIGTQAYSVNTTVDGKTENIILVPYADASQTGGEVTTWLKKN